MTIPASMPSRVVYLGDGMTVNYPLPFKYFANSDGTKQLKVYLADKTGENEVVLVENKDFKLTSAGEVNGTLTMNIAPSTTQKLTVVFDIPLEQPTDWEEFGRLPSESIEESFDRVTAILKQQDEVIERCVKVTASGNQAPQELLDEVYDKLDSATEIAGTAIAAANEAATAADNASAAVTSAGQTLADVTQYVNLSKTEIQNTRNEAVNTINLAVVDAKSSIAETVNDAESSIENTITQAVDEAKEQAVNAATATISTAKENIDAYVSDSIKPDLQSYVADAAESAQSASASASVAESSKTITELSKTAAELAANLAKQYRDEAKDFIQPTQATEEKLGLVKIATVAEVAAGTDNTKIVTPATAAEQYQSKTAAADESDRIMLVMDNHKNDKNNPHGVTKSQIGLGNVDNTSDLNKPISTAVQSALNNVSKSTSPKYTVEESRTWGTEYTATVAGFVAIDCNCSYGQQSELLVNGVRVLRIYQLGSVTGGNKLSAKVVAGDRYKGSGQAGTITFWPTY